MRQHIAGHSHHDLGPAHHDQGIVRVHLQVVKEFRDNTHMTMPRFPRFVAGEQDLCIRLVSSGIVALAIQQVMRGFHAMEDGQVPVLLSPPEYIFDSPNHWCTAQPTGND